MQAIWQFITDNQTTLSWLGGGVVVVLGGAWTVTKFFLKREKPKPVSADTGVAAGRDIVGSPITITRTTKSDDGTGA